MLNVVFLFYFPQNLRGERGTPEKHPGWGTPLFAASEGVMLPAGGAPLGAPALPRVSSVRARAPDRRDPGRVEEDKGPGE